MNNTNRRLGGWIACTLASTWMVLSPQAEETKDQAGHPAKLRVSRHDARAGRPPGFRGHTTAA